MTSTTQAAGTGSDLVFTGGSVITVDPQFRVAGGLAVDGGRIVAVGTSDDMAAWTGPRTRVVDLAGGAVLPGINDSHLHGGMLGAYTPTYWLESMGVGAFPVPRELATDDEKRAALLGVWQQLLALGITSYTEPGLGSATRGQHGGGCDDAMLRVYRACAAAGEIPLRVNALLLFGELDGPSRVAALEAGLRDAVPEGGDGPSRWRVAGVKLFADGIPPMHNAWMHEPYVGGGCGALMTGDGDDPARLAEFREMVRVAHDGGWQVAVHATGDRTIDESVRAFADAVDASGDDAAARDRRHYLVHGDLTSPATMETMARYGFGINAQPGIYTATTAMLDAAIGAERTDLAVAVRSAVEAGVTTCLSSDSPVSTPDWRVGMAAATLRQSGSDGAVRGPDQRMSVEQAIAAYTIAGARQDHAEDWKGSLEVGKVADLCVLAASPLDVAPAGIPAIDIVMTVVDGQVAFERGTTSAGIG